MEERFEKYLKNLKESGFIIRNKYLEECVIVKLNGFENEIRIDPKPRKRINIPDLKCI